MNDDFQHFDTVIANSAVLRRHMVARDFAANEMIIIEKDSTAHVYFILSGKVKVTSFHSNGKEVWHAALTSGYTFGEIAAISGAQRHSCHIKTLTHRYSAQSPVS